jgi:hypothetical protein
LSIGFIQQLLTLTLFLKFLAVVLGQQGLLDQLVQQERLVLLVQLDR